MHDNSYIRAMSILMRHVYFCLSYTSNQSFWVYFISRGRRRRADLTPWTIKVLIIVRYFLSVLATTRQSYGNSVRSVTIVPLLTITSA
jgi:hypothetical protein